MDTRGTVQSFLASQHTAKSTDGTKPTIAVHTEPP